MQQLPSAGEPNGILNVGHIDPKQGADTTFASCSRITTSAGGTPSAKFSAWTERRNRLTFRRSSGCVVRHPFDGAVGGQTVIGRTCVQVSWTACACAGDASATALQMA